MDSLKSYSIEFVLNRLNDRIHGSDGIRYVVTHIDRILYILSHAPSIARNSEPLPLAKRDEALHVLCSYL